MIKGGRPRHLRDNNSRIVLDLMRSSEIVSVLDIVKQVSLSKPTILKILDTLEQLNLVECIGKGASSEEGGRRPQLYRFNSLSAYPIAFHVFPHELYGVISDMNAEVLFSTSCSINQDTILGDFLQMCKRLIEILVQEAGISLSSIAGIAIGAHGVIDSKNGIVLNSPHFKKWRKKASITESLREVMDIQIPIIIDNQIRYQVITETLFGIAKGFSNVVVIEAGEGLVAGVYLNNELMIGDHYLCGEIGHMSLNPNHDALCACGNRGCFEALVSEERAIELARSYVSKYPESSLALYINQDRVTIYDLFSHAELNDPLACAVIDEIAFWFSVGINNIVLAYDPQFIVIQGMYANAGSFFKKELLTYLDTKFPLLAGKKISIGYSHMGKDRCVKGAASNISDAYLDSVLVR